MRSPFLSVFVGLLLVTGALSAQSKTVTIAGWDTWYPSVGYSSNPPVWQEIQKRSGIKIVFNIFDDYDTKMKTVMASGTDMPDLFIVPPSWSNAGVYKTAQDGLLLPLDNLIATSPNAANLRQLFKDRPDVKGLLTAPDGHIYTLGDMPLGGLAMQFQIRNDWLKKLKLAKPETADQWYTVLKAFKTKDPNGNGKADEVPWSWYGDLLPPAFMTAFGMTPEDYRADAQGKVTAQFASDKYKSYLAFLNKLYAEDLIDHEKRDKAGLTALMAQNKLGMEIEWTDNWTTFEKAVKGGGITDADVLPLPPAHPVGQKGYYVDRQPFWNQYGISATSKSVEASLKLLDFLLADPVGLTLKEFGIEGKSYTLVNGKPQYTAFVLNNPDGLAAMDAVRSLGGSPSLFARDLKEAFLQKAGTGAKFTTVYNELQPYLVKPFPQVIQLDQETRDLTKFLTDLTTYRSEMEDKFVTGKEPMAKFGDYVAQLKKLGLDQIVLIRQAQYDRYSGKK